MARPVAVIGKAIAGGGARGQGSPWSGTPGREGQVMKKIFACAAVVIAANAALYLADHTGSASAQRDTAVHAAPDRQQARPEQLADAAPLTPALTQSTTFHPDAQ